MTEPRVRIVDENVEPVLESTDPTITIAAFVGGRRVLASYTARVMLLEREDHAELPDAPQPSSVEIERIIGQALYLELPYYGADDIVVASTREFVGASTRVR